MILYNTLGQKKREIKTHTEGKVNMYTCGPTVYHYAHIGNLRTYIMEDVLDKVLRYEGDEGNRVMKRKLFLKSQSSTQTLSLMTAKSSTPNAPKL